MILTEIANNLPADKDFISMGKYEEIMHILPVKHKL